MELYWRTLFATLLLDLLSNLCLPLKEDLDLDNNWVLESSFSLIIISPPNLKVGEAGLVPPHQLLDYITCI